MTIFVTRSDTKRDRVSAAHPPRKEVTGNYRPASLKLDILDRSRLRSVGPNEGADLGIAVVCHDEVVSFDPDEFHQNLSPGSKIGAALITADRAYAALPVCSGVL